MFARHLVSLAALLLAAGQDSSSGPLTRTLEIGGRVRSYVVYLPASYATATSVPLVVNLHALRSTAESQCAGSGFLALHDDPKDGFALVCPQGVGNSWNAGGSCCGQALTEKVDDVAFLVEMVHRIRTEWPKIDAGRVYATGLSNGSAMAQRLGVEASDTFAAGAGYSYMLFADASENRLPFAYVNFAGYQDPSVAYDGGPRNPSVVQNTTTWVRLQGCKASPRIQPMSPPGTADQPNQCAYYEGCRGDVVVASCSLSGGHFLYVNYDEIDVSKMGWDFMKRFRREAGGTVPAR
jgi:poly(3-hydroxybutyrate) depolymerase